MAELHVQRKRNNYLWVWVVVILLIAVGIYYYMHYNNPNAYPIPGKPTSTLRNNTIPNYLTVNSTII